MADLKVVKPVLVAEITKPDKVLAPGDAVYRTVLVPAGKKVEIAILVDGKKLSTDSWIAVPKADCNVSAEIRMRVFDDCRVDTLAVKAVEAVE